MAGRIQWRRQLDIKLFKRIEENPIYSIFLVCGLLLSAFEEENRKSFGACGRACCFRKELDLLFLMWLFCRDHFTLRVNRGNNLNYTSFFLKKPINPRSNDALHFHESPFWSRPYSTIFLYFLQKNIQDIYFVNACRIL